MDFSQSFKVGWRYQAGSPGRQVRPLQASQPFDTGAIFLSSPRMSIGSWPQIAERRQARKNGPVGT